MEEIWKDAKYYWSNGEILDLAGYYQVSNLGNVRSVKRKWNSQHLMSIGKDKDGYATVAVVVRKKHYMLKLHRLLASTFLPNNINDYRSINHKSENKSENILSNLEWASVGYNNAYGSREHLNEKPILQFDKEGNFIKEWASASEVQRQMGYKYQSISGCCLGKKYRKTAYGYIWKFKEKAA